MCFAAPGPRCLSHTIPNLDEKKLKHEKMKANFEAATAALNAIPEGQNARKEQRAWDKAADAFQRSETKLAEAQAAYDNALKYDPTRLDKMIDEGRTIRDQIIDEADRIKREGSTDDAVAYREAHDAEFRKATELRDEGKRLRAERQALIDESKALKVERDALAEASENEHETTHGSSDDGTAVHEDTDLQGSRLAIGTTDSTTLSRLARDKSWRVRANVADNRNTSTATLEQLARDDDERVRSRIAGREELTEATFLALSEDDSRHVRIALTRNPAITPEAFKKLATDEREDVRQALYQSYSYDDKLVELLTANGLSAEDLVGIPESWKQKMAGI